MILDPPKAEELLRELVSIVETPAPYANFEFPKSTYNSSWGGGDCEKHGRWYGRCHCCDRDHQEFRARERRTFDHEQELRLRNLASSIKQVIDYQPTE